MLVVDDTFRNTLGARCADIILAQNLQHLPAHKPRHRGEAREHYHDNRGDQVPSKITKLAPRAQLPEVLAGHAAHRNQKPASGLKPLHCKRHDDKRQEKIGDGQPDETKDGQEPVTERILANRWKNADRHCNKIGQDGGG